MLVIFVFDLIFAALNFSMEMASLVYANMIHGSVMLGCFYLFRSGFFSVGRILFGLSLNLLIFVGVDVLGFEAGAHLFYIPLLIIPFVLFSRREIFFFSIFSVSPVFLYFLSLFGQTSLFFSKFTLPAEDAMIRTHSTMGTVFVCVFALLYYHYRLIALAEKAVDERQVEMLHMKQLSHIGEVSSSIAQEILRPTQSLLARAQSFKKEIEMLALDSGEDAKSTRSFCQEVEVGLTQIREISSSLQILSRQQGHLEHDDLKLSEVIQLAARLLKPRLDVLGAKIRIEVPLHLYIRQNRAEWVRIVHNLIENSVDELELQKAKSNSKDSVDLWVMVGAFVQNELLVLKFMDSGGGIDPIIKENFMHPFVTTKMNGSGLGLSVAKTFAEKLAGTFYFDSEAYNTTFVMKVPLESLGAEAAKTSAAS